MGSGVATFAPGVHALNVGAATSLTFDLGGSAGQSVGAQTGGKGARLVCTIPVTPGETLTLKVGDWAGAGGCPGGAGAVPNGGHGGGSTEVWRGSTRLLIAAGGGGAAGQPSVAAVSYNLGGGGDGGMTTGANGTPADHAINGVTVGAGKGATQSAGGVGGIGDGTTGTASTGGTSAGASAGGGGGGLFGGGGGGYWAINPSDSPPTGEVGAGGGGGGSSHVDSSATGVTSTDGANTDVGYLTVTGLDQPPAPTVTLTEDPAEARIIVTLATASPGAGETTAVSALLEGRRVSDQVVEWSRSGAAVALNGDTVHAIPTKGVDYEYRATAIDAVGSSASSGWVGSATGTPDDSSPLLDGGTPSTPNGVLL